MDNLILKNVTLGDSLTDITIDRASGTILSVEPTDLAGRDMAGARVIPGLVDIHSHGCVGYDVIDAEGMAEMCEFLAQNGTTSWCPTTMTAPVETIRRAVCEAQIPDKGAHVLGFHLEGPYINEKYCGAQSPELAIKPNSKDFDDLEQVVMMTLAPDVEGAIDYIARSPFKTVLGHTAANYETAKKAFEAGANCVTHLFNAMPPMHHREPSVVGAALTENAYVQIICDGIHIHPAVILAAYRMFGPDRMILISDAMAATGLDDGTYSLGGQPVFVRDGVARIENGALAGSTSTLAHCLRCAVSFGIPEADAIKMATETPARYLGVKKGIIAPGYDADLLVVDDKLNIKEVILCNQL